MATALALLSAPVAAEQFGSIAYSLKSNKFGRSWNYSSREEAEAVAKKHCAAQGGKQCATAAWVQDSCGATARAKSTKSIKQMGSAWGFADEAAARQRALAECKARNSGDCWIVASVCSSQ